MQSSSRLSAAVAEHLDRLLTPALVLDLDAVEHNIDAAIRRVGAAERWRPHVKTVKQRVVIARLLERGVHCFKCATVDELALVLDTAAAAGASADVLVAYPLREAACRAALALRDAHPESRVALLADSPAHARELAGWVAPASEVDVHLDVDLGMARTGTAPEVWGDALADGLESRLGGHLRIAGLHGYDGHLGADGRAEAWAGYERLCALALALPDRLLDLVTSGTHSYAHALAHPGLRAGPWRHQISPGTIVFSDLRSARAAADLGLQQAAFVATRVVHVAPGRATLDAGSKAITPDGTPPTCAVLDWPGLVPQRASEEHLPVAVASGPPPALGQLLWLVPDHVCTTVNLYRHALWVRGDRVVGHGPVEAASHPLWVDAGAAGVR